MQLSASHQQILVQCLRCMRAQFEWAASRAPRAAHRSGHQRGGQQSLVLQRCHVRRWTPQGIRVVQCSRATLEALIYLQRWRLRVLRMRSRVGIYSYWVFCVELILLSFLIVLCVLVSAPSRVRPVRDLYGIRTQLITRSSCARHMLTFTAFAHILLYTRTCPRLSCLRHIQVFECTNKTINYNSSWIQL